MHGLGVSTTRERQANFGRSPPLVPAPASLLPAFRVFQAGGLPRLDIGGRIRRRRVRRRHLGTDGASAAAQGGDDDVTTR
jgi:hypothetical protein